MPFEKLHKKWMWFVCEALETLFSQTEHYSEMFDMLWIKYGNVGFYVNIYKPTLRTKRSLPDTLQDMCAILLLQIAGLCI